MKNIIPSLMIMAVLLTISMAYAIWLDTLKVNVYVTIASGSFHIGSYRVFECCEHCCCCIKCKGLEDDQMVLSNDSSTLFLEDIKCCHHCHLHEKDTLLWVGLVIEHNATLPTKIYGVDIDVNGSYDSVEVEMYAYGPYSDGVGLHEWGHVDPSDLPYPGYNTSVVIVGNEKAILWIKIVVKECSGLVNLSVKPLAKPWNTS